MTVEDLLERHFENAHIRTRIEDGINKSYMFTDSGGDEYICKYFSSGLASGPSNYLGSLQLVDNYVVGTDQFSTPSIVDYGLYEGTPYLFYEYIDGDVLSVDQLLMDENSYEMYVRRIARALAELHLLENPVDKFGWYTLGDSGDVCLTTGYDSSSEMILSYLEHNFQEIRREEDAEFIEDRRDEIVQCVRDILEYSGVPVICHSDLKYSNIIDSDGELYLIDWEFPRSVDPMYEFVKTDRKLFGRYDHQNKMSSDQIEYLRSVFREEYFGRAPIEFDELRYECYWIQEMVECLGACTNWYDADEIPQVTSYYKSELESSLENIYQM